MNTKTARIRALNDRARLLSHGDRVVLTCGVVGFGPSFIEQALDAVATYDSFDADSDPWEEHDFGAIELGGIKLFWKIDYYDRTLTHGADDPSDEQSCRRVLTVMLAEEC